jgi:heme-degrading monooxygenase HmoA
MISRHWKGITKPGQAEGYISHLKNDTFPKLSTIPGFVRASILKRDVGEGIEFQIVTLWESLTAIQAFAGQNAEVAVVPPVIQAMMADYDRHVVHYEVAETYAPR